MQHRTLLVALLAIQIPASADIITILPATSIANATAERNTWLTTNFGVGTTPYTLTTFENYGYGSLTSLATGIGTFSVLPDGLASTGSGTHSNKFTILSDSNSPFTGRYNSTPGGVKWLDSNDVTELQLTTTFNALYFFITDVDDWSGALEIQTADGSTAYFPTDNANGSIFFVGISSPDPIGYVRWQETNRADGYGLDDFGIPHFAPVPEPAWAGAVVALLILAAAVRHRGKAVSSR